MDQVTLRPRTTTSGSASCDPYDSALELRVVRACGRLPRIRSRESGATTGPMKSSAHATSRHGDPKRGAARMVGMLALALVGLLMLPSLVSAQYDEGITPFGVLVGGTRYANNYSHSYRSTELDVTELNRWQPRFDGAGGQDVYNPTAIQLVRAADYALYSDFYWYVDGLTIGTAGTYLCTLPQSDSVCSMGRIIIADDAHQLSDLLQNNLVCHEIGHSIGFGHGTSGTSCMSSGDNNLLNTIEIGLINQHY